MTANRNVTDLANIGPKIAGRLNAVGIFSEADLRRAGAAKAHRMVTEKFSAERLPVCYYLYSFEGALTDTHWNGIGEAKKQALQRETAQKKGQRLRSARLN